MGLSRRDLLASAGVATAAAAVGALTGAAPAFAAERDPARRRPNIVLILVDEMRYPMHFPAGVHTPEQWLAQFMPNVHGLWRRGVKFAQHYTAGTACSPSRASLVTGLYPHQNWCLQTRKGANPGANAPNAPALQAAFPTYGKLLRESGYRTPYVGKWHLSDPPEGAVRYLGNYGFDGLTIPDPIGTNGEGVAKDGDIADQARTWLATRKPGQDPFCLTVSFVNPHDQEYFWAGTEADTFNALFAQADVTPYSQYSAVPGIDNPSVYGYPMPQNWESAQTLAANKPGLQSFTRAFSELVWGGINDDPASTEATVVPYPGVPGAYIGKAPYSYWQRAQDSYTLLQSMVDKHIGTVVDSIPASIRNNTIVIFTADHGDYAGSHGLPANKAGSMYQEAINVPLIVVDPREQLTGDLDRVRTELTSSVDLMPLLATIARGDRSWLTGDYAAIYGERLDLMPLLASRRARGRGHVVMASDEWVPGYFDYNQSSRHVMGVRTKNRKVATYAEWGPAGRIAPASMQVESYDYSTAAGRLELENLHAETGADQKALRALLTTFQRTQLQARMPAKYQRAALRGKAQYLAYIGLLDALQPDGSVAVPNWLADYIQV